MIITYIIYHSFYSISRLSAVLHKIIANIRISGELSRIFYDIMNNFAVQLANK